MSREVSAVRRSDRLRKKDPEFKPREDPEGLLHSSPRNRSSPRLNAEKNDIILTTKNDAEKLKQRQRNLAYGWKESLTAEESNEDRYTEAIAASSQQQQNHRTENVSASGQSSPYSKGKNGFGKKHERSLFTASTTSQPTRQRHTVVRREQFYSKSTIVPFVMMAFLLVLFISYFVFWKDNQKISFDLPNSFPSQSKELWGIVSHGMNSMDPFVVLLVHENQDDLARCLAERIVKKVVSGRIKHSVDPIFIDGKYVTKESHSLQNLRLQMEKQTGLVLLHLEDLPANVAEDLHFVLDTYSPWIRGGAYVLTLNLPIINTNVKPFSAVQKFLENKWAREIKPDHLVPLIARVGNFVYVVKTDPNPCEGS